MILSDSGGAKKKAVKTKTKSTGYKGSKPLISRDNDGDIKVSKKKKTSKPPKSTGYKGSHPTLGGERKSDGVDKPKKKKSSKPPKSTGYKGSKPLLGGDRNSDKAQTVKKKSTKVVEKKKSTKPKSTGYTGSHPLLGGNRNSDQNPPKKKSTAKKKTTSSSYSGAKPSKRNSNKPLIDVQPDNSKRDLGKLEQKWIVNPAPAKGYKPKNKTKTNAVVKKTDPVRKKSNAIVQKASAKPKPTLQQYVNASKPNQSGTTTYVVKAGDTLSGITDKYLGHGKSDAYMAVARANGIKNADKIKVGQRITLNTPNKAKRPSGKK